MPNPEQTAMANDEADLAAQAAAAEAAQTAGNAPDEAAQEAQDVQQVEADIQQLVTDAAVPAPPTILYARILASASLPDPCPFFQSQTMLSKETWTEIDPGDVTEAINNPFVVTMMG